MTAARLHDNVRFSGRGGRLRCWLEQGFRQYLYIWGWEAEGYRNTRGLVYLVNVVAYNFEGRRRNECSAAIRAPPYLRRGSVVSTRLGKDLKL